MEHGNDNLVIKFLKYGSVVLLVVSIGMVGAIWYEILCPSPTVAISDSTVSQTTQDKSSTKSNTDWISSDTKKDDTTGVLTVDATCEITINSIKLTSDCDYSQQPTPQQVVLVDYTYKNTGTSDDFKIDSSDFLVTDKAGALLESYPVNKGVVESSAVKVGEEGHGVFALGVKHASESLNIQIKKSDKLSPGKTLKIRIQ